MQHEAARGQARMGCGRQALVADDARALRLHIVAALKHFQRRTVRPAAGRCDPPRANPAVSTCCACRACLASLLRKGCSANAGHDGRSLAHEPEGVRPMRIRHSVLTAAVLVVLGASGQLMAQDQNEAGAGDNNATSGNNRDNMTQAVASGAGSAAADNNSTATASTTNTATDSFNTSSNTVVATTQLSGTVTGNGVSGLGNVANNAGSAGGGAGGAGGAGVGGAGVGGAGTGGAGGDGGDAGSASDRAGDSASATQTAAAGQSASDAYAEARSRARERGAGAASADSQSQADAWSNADTSATGGDSTASNSGSSGDAAAWGGAGGAGGAGTGGDGTGGDGNGGSGGAGGAGGVAYAHSGSFDMSNAMNGSGNAAAGIMVMAQNSGAASLIQQGITVQANLTVGP
ncbi:hypothetical protein ACFQ2D_04475 [Luteimonas composti]